MRKTIILFLAILATIGYSAQIKNGKKFKTILFGYNDHIGDAVDHIAHNPGIDELTYDTARQKFLFNIFAPLRFRNDEGSFNWFCNFTSNYIDSVYKGSEFRAQATTPNLNGCFFTTLLDNSADLEDRRYHNDILNVAEFNNYIDTILVREYRLVQNRPGLTVAQKTAILENKDERPLGGWYLADEPITRNHDMEVIISMATNIRVRESIFAADHGLNITNYQADRFIIFNSTNLGIHSFFTSFASADSIKRFCYNWDGVWKDYKDTDTPNSIYSNKFGLSQFQPFYEIAYVDHYSFNVNYWDTIIKQVRKDFKSSGRTVPQIIPIFAIHESSTVLDDVFCLKLKQTINRIQYYQDVQGFGFYAYDGGSTSHASGSNFNTIWDNGDTDTNDLKGVLLSINDNISTYREYFDGVAGAKPGSDAIYLIWDKPSSTNFDKTWKFELWRYSNDEYTNYIQADFNHDGSDDIAATKLGGQWGIECKALYGDSFAQVFKQGSFTPNSSANAQASGDFDGDGKTDLAVHRSNSHDVFIYYSNSPIPTDTIRLYTDGNTNYQDKMIAADIDCDIVNNHTKRNGKDELIFTTFGQWLEIRGLTSTNTLDYLYGTSIWTTGNNGTDFLGKGDFDGDGRMEIIAHEKNTANYKMLRFDPSAPVNNYKIDVHILNNILRPRVQGAITIGDYDSDGRDELVVAQYQTNTTLKRYRFTFQTVSPWGVITDVRDTWPIPSANIKQLTSGDYDGDGIEEIAFETEQHYLYMFDYYNLRPTKPGSPGSYVHSSILTKNLTSSVSFSKIISGAFVSKEPLLNKNTANESVVVQPEMFTLLQNYPNPFNPNTQIQFMIPNKSRTVLKIYNIQGQEVCTLLNQDLSEGTHSVIWDGKDAYGNVVSSGIYFYRIQTKDFTDVKKMTLMK